MQQSFVYQFQKQGRVVGRGVPVVVCRPKTAKRVVVRPQAAAVELQHSTTEKTSHQSKEKVDENELDQFSKKQATKGKSLSSVQMQKLLTLICDGTEFAQLDLQIGEFELKLKRSKGGAVGQVNNVQEGVAVADSSSSEAASSVSSVDQSILASVDFTESEDEILAATLLPISAPKVGVLRRGRYVKGKRIGKADLINEGDEVKKGQVVCYIEQLGTHIPVEAPQAGEVVMILEDGTPVEYLQSVAEIAPFFGGHIIGDRKYA
eukprot:TRINITY_DN13889_c0_g1_i1.p1 TRINITY_DN13889_c0_g1~~TRINITY_DN13889_c0_g1_i1.p1  ORF type:complete len:263 (+),score=39.65 TRINITY_DN13889_c0_g1_i1:68-856(+)